MKTVVQDDFSGPIAARVEFSQGSTIDFQGRIESVGEDVFSELELTTALPPHWESPPDRHEVLRRLEANLAQLALHLAVDPVGGVPASRDFLSMIDASFSFPPLPVLPPVCLPKGAVLARHPELASVLEGWSDACRAAGWPGDQGGLTVPRHRLAGGSPDTESGRALLLCLPSEMEANLPELVAQKPCVQGWPSQDLLSSTVVLTWTAQCPDSACYRLLVAETDLTELLGYACGDGAELRYVPLVLLAGESVALGGFWWDGSDVLDAQAIAMNCGENYAPHRLYSEAELAAAAERAHLVGSPTPWQEGPWRDDDGSTVLQCRVMALETTVSNA